MYGEVERSTSWPLVKEKYYFANFKDLLDYVIDSSQDLERTLVKIYDLNNNLVKYLTKK